MADDIYGLTQRDVQLLRELARRFHRNYDNLSRESSDWVDHEESPAPDVYVARTPYEGIAALVPEVGTGVNDVPAYSNCYIYHLIEDPDDDDLMKLQPIDDFYRRVYNISACDILGEQWIYVIRSKGGAWFALDVCRSDEDLATTTTRTTYRGCGGSCLWQCASNEETSGTGTISTYYTWELITDGCQSDFTTGTGTHIEAGTSEECVCYEPNFCCETCEGMGAQAVTTVTLCTRGLTNSQPICSTAQTSATTGTTTPPPEPWCLTCKFVCTPDFGWVLIDLPGCSEQDCDPPLTTCTAILCGTLEDGYDRGTFELLDTYCKGTCIWIWVGETEEITTEYYNGWLLYSQRCFYSNVICYCDTPPSIAGGECGAIVELPCGGGVDPSTTTTGTGCNGNCIWQYNGTLGAWALLCMNCPGYCVCPTVPFAGGFSGLTATYSCDTSTTATTTSSTTSSTTTSSTTTPCGGTCTWECIVEQYFSYWSLTSNDCTGVCVCYPPTAACVVDGSYAQTDCAVSTTTTTTTTTSTTTSTTTTCTTTAWPAPTCGVCIYRVNCDYGVPVSWELFSSGCTDVACGCQTPTCFNPSEVGCPNEGNPTGSTIETSCANTTTTTTLPPACGTCQFVCTAGLWAVTVSSCTGGCNCDYPGATCPVEGETDQTHCIL